ncbi:Ribosomal lysine N-methyltransferase set11 [Botrytis cinerea]
MDMQVHQEFTKWAVNQGVVINDVSPFRFPEKGLGLVANKNFETGDILVQVPIKVLRKATDVPSQFAALAPDIAVHALFALSLDSLLGPEWIATLPSKQDMHSSMPLFWDISLQELLPIVNSRTFYYLSPTIKPSKPQPSKENRLALNPFADYINHSSEPTVDATLSRAGYTLTASQPIKQGSEVHISYGSHNNDFLLVEYGFILEDNRWDEVTLDPWITPLLSVEQKEHLEETGFLGKYLLDRDTICYRTQVVLRILCLPIGRWRRFVQGSEDEEVSEEDAGKVLLKVLMAGKVEIVETIKKVEESQAGLEGQRETLSRRSNQIVLLLNRALHRIRC